MLKMLKKILFVLTTLILLSCTYFCFINKAQNEWVIEETEFKAKDGFLLKAYYLHPKNSNKKYPAVACLHQLWGNRDDFLKLFPYFAKSGIIAIAPNFPRQRPNLDHRRISDLTDSINFLENMKSVDSKRIGIITASFTVETGLMAIRGKKNVIADVMISGPVLSENSKKWITRNSNLAIYTITSIFDQKPDHPPFHHLVMEECLKRSLNPFSRSFFIKDKKNKFSIYAHGTFLFDEIPQSLNKIQNFFTDVFEIKNKENGFIREVLPKYTVFFKSTDGFPITATYKQPKAINNKIPAVILYPPQFYNREIYKELIYQFIARGIAVLLPNIKRTCREQRTLHLCDKEINGAINFLKERKDIDNNRIGIMLPSFYFLSAEQLIKDKKIPVKTIILMHFGRLDFGVKVEHILKNKNNYDIHYIEKKNFDKMIYLFRKNL